jgi:hypothetical protein
VITELVAPVPPGETGLMEFYVTTPDVTEETPIFEEMTLDDNGNKFGDIQLALTVVPGIEEGEESGEGSEHSDIEGGCAAGGGGLGGGALAFFLLGFTGLVRRRRAA